LKVYDNNSGREHNTHSIIKTLANVLIIKTHITNIANVM